MPSRGEAVTAAKSWLRTPWGHQGRLKGIRADCAGVVNMVGFEIGAVTAEDAGNTNYGRTPNPLQMKAALDKLYDRGELNGQPRPGSILWIRPGNYPQHIGVVSDRGTLIHAVTDRCVEETPLAAFPARRIVAVYEYRGVID